MITYSLLANDEEWRCDCCCEHIAWSYEIERDELDLDRKGPHICDACHHACALCGGPREGHDETLCDRCLVEDDRRMAVAS